MRAFIMQVCVVLALMGVLSGSAVLAGRADITPDQRDRLKSMAIQTRQKTMAERDALRKARGDLLNAYQNYELDERAARSAMDKVHTAQLNLLNLHLDNQTSIRGILNEEQFNQFRDMMHRRARGKGARFGNRHDDAFAQAIQDPGVMDSLGLSSDQRKKLGQLSAVMQKRSQVVDRMKRLTIQMLDSYSTYNLDTAAARGLVGEIHQGQVELSNLSLKTQNIIRSALTKPQFEQLVQEVQKRVKDSRGQRGNAG